MAYAVYSQLGSARRRLDAFPSRIDAEVYADMMARQHGDYPVVFVVVEEKR